MTRQDYIVDVTRPGPFQHEAPYVPYYWGLYLDGGATRDDGTVLEFDVLPIDRAMFPELKERETVRLLQDGNGFICEV